MGVGWRAPKLLSNHVNFSYKLTLKSGIIRSVPLRRKHQEKTTTTTNVKLNTLHILLKNGYFGSLFVSDVLVDGEDEHEDEEEASAAKEVPEVMSEVKSNH